MRPADLSEHTFDRCSPGARALAIRHLQLLRRLPPVLAPLLFGRIASYDDQFPSEQDLLCRDLDYLESLNPSDLNRLTEGFASIRLTPELDSVNWVEHPATFSQQLSTSLWATGQMDAFRSAAGSWIEQLRRSVSLPEPAIARVCVVIMGQGAPATTTPLFRKLRPHGVYFASLDPQQGIAEILQFLERRAAAQPVPYAHWYIDGGSPASLASAHVSCVSYATLAPARQALTRRMDAVVRSGSGGPEMLSAMMIGLRAVDLGIASTPPAPALDALQLSLLTEGSGTQIFSTTFVQWTAREVLRRAQPLTLVARFAPRQRYRPMNELLTGDSAVELDPAGSLIDADMGAFYTWLDLQRLSGADRSVFIAWFEDHGEALVIAPGMPAGTESASSLQMQRVLQLVSEQS